MVLTTVEEFVLVTSDDAKLFDQLEDLVLKLPGEVIFIMIPIAFALIAAVMKTLFS